jgi:hypothetical protein
MYIRIKTMSQDNSSALSENIRFHYPFANRYLDAAIAKIGLSKIFTDGKYKRYKEFYIGAVIAQALSEINNIDFFIMTPDPGNDPPDFGLRHFIKIDEEKTSEGEIDFELVDYTKYSKSIDEVIDKKLGLNYPEDYGIVALFRHETETTLDIDELRKKYIAEKRWILIAMRTNETTSGIQLGKDRWLVVSLTSPYFEKLITRDTVDKVGVVECYRVIGRGRDLLPSESPISIQLPS